MATSMSGCDGMQGCYIWAYIKIKSIVPVNQTISYLLLNIISAIINGHSWFMQMSPILEVWIAFELMVKIVEFCLANCTRFCVFVFSMLDIYGRALKHSFVAHV